ncbi:MAG: FMN-binding protein [Deltaproteobacteria bacterium]|nr:FMN-binding protein [Deltaproteobacteria bacterium]
MKIYISILLLAVVLLWTNPVTGKVYLTKDDALKQAFPEAIETERLTVFLNDDDVKKIQELSKAKVNSKIFTYYMAKGKDGVIGYTVFESHIVRTKPEVFMLVITPKGDIAHIEILAFYEPEEYLPPKRWLDLFKGRRLDDRFRVRSGISAISGASITSEGITRAIRNILAIFELKILKKEGK